MTATTTRSTSTVNSRAPRAATKGRVSSTRQSTRRTTRNALSTADAQGAGKTSRAARNKLTPAPSEETRSVTPSVGAIEPATPVKVEFQQDSPKSGSDKENTVPLLAVPSLLGSVKKDQQHTPPPEYVSPRKLDIARLTATDLAPVQEGPRNRIVITHLVLDNFKSYAGRQLIGPFHTVSPSELDLT
jgi:structural maintenance of chromosome 4